MRATVNPYKGYANCPEVLITDVPVPPIFAVYHKGEDGIYWSQREDGFTDFVFNRAELVQLEPGKWTTKTRTEGFGGRNIPLFVADLGEVVLRGAWSGGFHCANKHLPKPTFCVSLPEHCLAGKLTIEVLNQLLAGTGWEIVETTGPWDHNDGYWVEPVYNGQKKRHMSKELIDRLHEEYMAQDVRALSMYAAR
jgi:hypothetical protein